MKLLVFAHTPPPHHGQSYMVQLMLEGLGGDWLKVDSKEDPGGGLGISCYHINARLSRTSQEIGGFQPNKLFLLLGYCLRAVNCRFRYGIDSFYYIPAPSHRAALYRDWLVMILCRPFFKHIILHWHAAGLATWLETSTSKLSRWLTLQLLGRVDLSIVLSKYNRPDGEKLLSKQIRIIGNGIPDPCPEFKRELLPRRLARHAARGALISGALINSIDVQPAGEDPHIVKLLYLAHCTREKGLFDALGAVALANRNCTQSESPLRFHLTVAGEFLNSIEREEFETRLQQPDLQLPESHRLRAKTGDSGSSAIRYIGFVGGAEKVRAFTESDCFCFPSYYHAESFGLVLVEAMAFGLPIVATRWRSLPELFPPGYPGLVDIQSPEHLASAFEGVLADKTGVELREVFLQRFTLQAHLHQLAEAFRSIN